MWLVSENIGWRVSIAFRAFQVFRGHLGVAIPAITCISATLYIIMARGKQGKKGGKSTAPKAAPKVNSKDASINRINTFEDTLEEGGVDECEYFGYVEGVHRAD
jgi:hypothetical protein